MPRNPDSDHIDRVSNPSSGSLLANVDGDLQGFESEKNTTGIGNEEYLAGRRSLSRSAEFSRNRVTSGRTFIQDWGFEIATWASSILCIAALASCFRYRTRRRSQNWLTGFLLTLWFGECTSQLKWMWFSGKAKKLVQFGAFDEASRGAWGSFTFFFKLPIFKLAGACALITVIATAASPVTQQVVSYPTLLICVDTAVAARADSYLADSISENPLQISVRNDDITASMRGAVNAGLYANSSSPLALLEPQCATRNCTWEIFHSLSVCSQTVDISDHIANTTNEPNLLVRTLPNGVYLSFHRTVGESMNITTSDHFNGSIAFSTIKNPISNFIVIADVSAGAAEGINVTAAESILYFCVKRYNYTVKNGKSTIFETTLDSNTIYRNTFGERSGFYTTNITVPSDNTNYAAREFSLGDEFLVGQTGDGSISTPAAQVFLVALFSEPRDLTALRAIVENMGISMTNNVRTHGIKVSDAIGKTCTDTTFVKIRWAYLSFLAFLSAASGVLLFMTMFWSKKLGIRAWKSTSLPVLQCLDGRSVEVFGDMSDVDAVKLRAKHIEVRLMSRGGTRLVQE